MHQSKTKLVEDLLKMPESPNRDKMVRLARSGHFHPDTSPLGNPKHQCLAELRKVRFHDIAAKVEAGVYD